MSEMLVTITIIGILAALLLTALTHGVGIAQRTSCVNNERQIGQAIQMFLVDKHAYPLAAIDYEDHYTGWENQLARVELDAPAHREKPPNYPRPGIWHCPSAYLPPGFSGAYADYGYNCYGLSPPTATNSLGLGGQHIWIPGVQQPAPPINVSDVAVPSDMMAVGDGFKGSRSVIQDGWYYLWRTYGMQEEREYVGSTKRTYLRHQGRPTWYFATATLNRPP